MASLAGCGTGNARFVTESEVARASLEAALTSWRDGKPFGAIESTPPVRVADSDWQAGQQIESFQIGDEEDQDDGTRRFPVKLKLKKEGAKDVRYVVQGRDPVWVFSETDYQRMIDMDNGKETTKAKKGMGRRER
jgi:hypothetical protein